MVGQGATGRPPCTVLMRDSAVEAQGSAWGGEQGSGAQGRGGVLARLVRMRNSGDRTEE